MPPSSRASGGNGLVERRRAGQPDARFHGNGDPSRLPPSPNVRATLGTPGERRPRPTPICTLVSRPPLEPQLSLTTRQYAGPLPAHAAPTRRPFGRCLRTRGWQRRNRGTGQLTNGPQEVAFDGRQDGRQDTGAGRPREVR